MKKEWDRAIYSCPVFLCIHINTQYFTQAQERCWMNLLIFFCSRSIIVRLIYCRVICLISCIYRITFIFQVFKILLPWTGLIDALIDQHCRFKTISILQAYKTPSVFQKHNTSPQNRATRNCCRVTGQQLIQPRLCKFFQTEELLDTNFNVPVLRTGSLFLLPVANIATG